MAKISLIAPQKEGLLEGNPASILHLGAWIRDHTNFLVDIAQNLEDIDTNTDYVGISVTSATYQAGLKLASDLKIRNSRIKTILGGPHTTGQGKIIHENHLDIDFVVEGPGERALVEILNGANESVLFGGFLTEDELGQVTVEDLFDCSPDYFESMRLFGRMNYISTRGCPHSCSFCASSGALSKKSVDAVVDDLKALREKGHSEISIQDNYFGYDTQRIVDVCNSLIEKEISPDWHCQTRVESMQDSELLQLMKQAGCSEAYLGVENFHPRILEQIRKTGDATTYLERTQKAIKNMLDVGIKPRLNLQMGIPNEDEEVRQTNIQSLHSIGALAHDEDITVYTHLYVTYPGTPDFYQLVQQGMPEDIFEAYTLWENENKNDVNALLKSHNFMHGQGGIPIGLLDIDKLKQGEFVVLPEKVEAINRYLLELKNIEGIKIYV